MKVVIMSSFNTVNVFGKDITPFLSKIWATHTHSELEGFCFSHALWAADCFLQPGVPIRMEMADNKRPPQNHRHHFPNEHGTEEYCSFLKKSEK